MNEKTLDISWKTILKITFAIFCFYIIYLIKDILILLLFALIISLLFNPAIDFLEKIRISRTLSVVLVYLAIFGFLGLIIYYSLPIFASEFSQFSGLFPQYFEKISPPLKEIGIKPFENIEAFIGAIKIIIEKASANIFSALSIIFGGIASTISIIALSLFLSLEKEGVEKIIKLFSSKGKEEYILSVFKRCQTKISGWFGARILSCIFIGIIVFIVLQIFEIKYSFVLAILAAILDFIPIIGPIIAGLIVTLFVSLSSLTKAIFVLIAFILIQQIEGNIISPILTKKFIGLSPVLVLISLAIGAKLLGILGAILAVPLTAIIFEFTKAILEKKKEEATPLNK